MFRDSKVDKFYLKTIKTLRKCWFPSPEYEEFDLYEIPSFIFKKQFPDHKDIKKDIMEVVTRLLPGLGRLVEAKTHLMLMM